jgi:hypothetical protein
MLLFEVSMLALGPLCTLTDIGAPIFGLPIILLAFDRDHTSSLSYV